jgi:hypothetical protein
MDRHWSRWCAFLEGHGYSPADFDRGALIQFVSTFGAEVPLGSHKLAIAALTTTYNMALGVDLNCVDGVSDQPLFYTKKAQRSDATAVAKPAKALRVQHALDPLPYIRYWDSQPPNSELSDQELTLKTVVLLRLAGFRAVDLARMPAGVGAGFRWPDEGLELRSFNTKTRNSKQDVERGGWTNWSLLREVDPSRVMAAWQALGLDLVHPENVCAVRAFRELARRLADTWAMHGMLAFRAPHKGGVLGGVKCLAPGCFLHMVPVQHNICCVADAQLLSAWVRNFHTDRLYRKGLVSRGMGLHDDLSPGILRHGLVSRLLHLGLQDVCLSRTRHTDIATARKYYLLPLDVLLLARIDRLWLAAPDTANVLTADEWCLI